MSIPLLQVKWVTLTYFKRRLTHLLLHFFNGLEDKLRLHGVCHRYLLLILVETTRRLLHLAELPSQLLLLMPTDDSLPLVDGLFMAYKSSLGAVMNQLASQTCSRAPSGITRRQRRLCLWEERFGAQVCGQNGLELLLMLRGSELIELCQHR